MYNTCSFGTFRSKRGDTRFSIYENAAVFYTVGTILQNVWKSDKPTYQKDQQTADTIRFFYLTAYIIFYAVEWLAPGIISTGATGILDVFTQTQWFNGYIWFLLALFWCNLIFGLISINIRNEIYRALAVAVVAAGGALLAVYDIFVPMNIHSAMTAMPFFYIGYLLKKTPLLYKNRYDKYNWLAVIVLYTLSLALELWWDNPRIGFHANNITGNYILAIIYSTIAVLTILMLCKMIGHLPFVSYFGRYSIIPLCLHHMVYRPVSIALQIFNIPNRGGI